MPKKIIIPATDDLWDEANNRFVSMKEHTLVIEHSLLSISKWEQKHEKAFITDGSSPMTVDELKDYIRCMTLNQVDDKVYDYLPLSVIKEIEDYISKPMTATSFYDYGQNEGPTSRKKITCEEIYYKMISYGIPLEFEKRHINHLIALIRVFDIRGGNQKKMSQAEAAALQRRVNESRRRKR